MSYENYRTQLVLRLQDKLPPKVLNDVMAEVDLLSIDYDIKRSCVDLIVAGSQQPMIGMYIASLSVENRSPGTLRDYRMHLNNFFDMVRKPYNQVTANDIRGYLAYKRMHDHNCPESCDHIRTVLKSFYCWLVDNEYVSRNPTNPIKPAKLPKKKLKPLSPMEMVEFRNACTTDRERALVDFLYSTGCRVSEVSHMLISDIDWNDHSVFIRNGKGGKDRICYLNAEAEISLRKYLADRPGNGQSIFTSYRSPYRALCTKALEEEIKVIRDRIPDKLSFKVTPHSFRRTMCTTAAERGMPVQYIQQLAGHASLDTTMQYITTQQYDVKNSHRKYLAG